MDGNPLRGATDRARSLVLAEVNSIGSEIASGMRANLSAGGHVDTGRLLGSIHHSISESDGSIEAEVFADAENSDGDMYYVFIEKGSSPSSGGESSWRYKDSNGEWHTTHGMAADPFIEPAKDDVLPGAGQRIFDAFMRGLNGGAE